MVGHFVDGVIIAKHKYQDLILCLLTPNYARAHGNAVTEAPRETRDLKIFYEFIISFLSGGAILL